MKRGHIKQPRWLEIDTLLSRQVSVKLHLQRRRCRAGKGKMPQIASRTPMSKFIAKGYNKLTEQYITGTVCGN